MANSRINRNDLLGIGPSATKSTRGTQSRSGLDGRQIDSILGIAASESLSHPTASHASFHRSAYSRTTQSQHFTSTGQIYGLTATRMLPISGGRPRSSQEDLVGANATACLQRARGRGFTKDLVGAMATTTINQNSTYSRFGSSPSTQSATANTTGTIVRTESYRYVTPETGSSQVTVFPSYKNHYQQQISPNYCNHNRTVPMGVGEATIDSISNAGSTFLTLGRKLLQRKWT